MIFVRICWTLVLYYCLGKRAKVIRQQFKIALQARAIKTCAHLKLFLDKANTSTAWKLRCFKSIINPTWNNTTMTSPDWDDKTRRGPNDQNRRILQNFPNIPQQNTKKSNWKGSCQSLQRRHHRFFCMEKSKAKTLRPHPRADRTDPLDKHYLDVGHCRGRLRPTQIVNTLEESSC